MAQHRGKQEKCKERVHSDFVEEVEKFLYQAEINRSISKEARCIIQEFDRIYAEVAAAHIERVSLLKQMDRIIIQFNSPVIAANHKKH